MMFLEIEDREHSLQQFPATRRRGRVIISFQLCYECCLPRYALPTVAHMAPCHLQFRFGAVAH